MSKTPDERLKQEHALFSNAVADIHPLQQDKIIPSSAKNRVFVAKTDFSDSDDNDDGLSDEYDPFENDQQKNDLNYRHSSISKRQFSALKKGGFERNIVLDLHGCNRPEARRKLIEFLTYCEQHNYRRVAIMPGQGRGILRQALNSWLRQLAQVLAFAESPQRSGGKGIIQLLLSKSSGYSTK